MEPHAEAWFECENCDLWYPESHPWLLWYESEHGEDNEAWYAARWSCMMCQADWNHKTNGTCFDVDTSMKQERQVIEHDGQFIRVTTWSWQGECAVIACKGRRRRQRQRPH